MKAIEIIKRVSLSKGDECTDSEALSMLKNIPNSLDKFILEENWDEFEKRFSLIYPYLYLSDNEINNLEFSVISNKINLLMNESNMTVADLAKVTGVSGSTILDFLSNKQGLVTIKKFQEIASYFNLSLDLIDREEFSIKYLSPLPKEEESDEELPEDDVNGEDEIPEEPQTGEENNEEDTPNEGDDDDATKGEEVTETEAEKEPTDDVGDEDKSEEKVHQ